MNQISINTRSMVNSIRSLTEELERLKHRGEIVCAIPEINEMKPYVFLDEAHIENWGDNWTVTFQFDKCYARITGNCQIQFVHHDDVYGTGRKEELVPYYDDKQLVEEFKKHVEFLK